MRSLAAAAASLLFLSVSFAQAPCPAPANTGSIASAQWAYQITLADSQRHLLHVKLQIAPTSADLKIQMPVWNATYQVRDFAQYVNWLRAADAKGRSIPARKLDKTTWSVPNATTVEYEIAALNTGPFGAEFSSEHLFLNLAEVLVYPFGVPNQLVQLRVENLPSGWKLATPLNSGDGSFCAESYDRLVDSPIEAGNFRELTFDSGGAHYRIIIHADPDDYDANSIQNVLRKIADAEVDWMQDRPFDRYMFIYHFPREPGRGGMEHAYSTAIETSTARLQRNPLAILGVSAHEFFHLWNVKRIRPQSLEPIDYTREMYTRALWFSEGVTSTVGEHMLVRAGLIDEPTFLARLASEIRQFELRPARHTQSAEESSVDAWLEKYPYYRSPERSVSYYNSGQIIGVLLDLEMRRVSNGTKSLRDLVHHLNDHYAKQGRFFNDSEGVRLAAEAVTGASFDSFFERFVGGTEEIPYDDLFRQVGLKLERRIVTIADAGFTAATNFSPNPVVIDVTPGSEAEKAGLKAGDAILALNGEEPDALVVEQIAEMNPGSTVKLKVSAKSGTRDVRYKLAAKADIDFVFSDREDITDAQHARRAAWLRGDSEPGDATP
jgi:predicted metalloprotease with PDZ domain